MNKKPAGVKMMSWIMQRNNTPVVERPRVEPGATFSLFENHWKQATEAMGSSEESPSEAALTVISHLNQMISFLRIARTEDPEQNCKQFWIRNRCSDTVIKWLHALQIQGMQLEYEDELKLVQALQSLCELASKDGELLGYVRSDLGSDWDGACSLCSLLLEYSLKSDPYLGEPARNSFIHLIKLASRYPRLESSFSQETGLGLTNVVISGLSACFAQLPTFTPGTVEQLIPFVTQLKFVDSVTHAAPPKVSSTIAECFSIAFLHAVILPALTQDEGNRSMHSQDDQFTTSLHEEIAIVTNYLKIVCEHLTHPLLVKSLLLFVTSNLLSVLIQRMNHPNTAVTVSTLGLVSVLLEFYCEDFWYELILRHLMPQNHLMVSQRTTRHPHIDFHDASVRFISLLPVSVLDAMGPEAVTYHYTQYLSNELTRWSSFDDLSLSITPPFSPSLSEEPRSSSSCSSGTSSSTNVHPVFSFWKFKYDGTDEVISLPPQQLSSSRSDDKNSLAEEASSDAVEPAPDNTDEGSPSSRKKRLGTLDLGREDEVAPTDPLTPLLLDSVEDPLLQFEKKQTFTTISLQHTPSEEMNSIGISEPSCHDSEPVSDFMGSSSKNLNSSMNNANSDGYGSLESSSGAAGGTNGTGGENPSSFGPFLDILLNHLTNYTRLPPDVILMVTDIISTLAASRIPIVSSILLDSNLILQPSYIAFPMLLNRIRVELDQNLKGYHSVLCEVWKSMSKDLQPMRSPRESLVNSFSSTFDFSGDNSFTDNLKKKITSSNSFTAALNQVFQRKSTGSGGSSNNSNNNSMTQQPGDSFGPQRGLAEDVQSAGGQNYRYVNRTPNTTVGNQSSEAIRIMATRGIFFTHWLLELGAIAQQLCWKRPIV